MSEKIEVITSWWASAISNPKFDNGDNSAAGGLGAVMALSMREDVTPDQVDKFKAVLAVDWVSLMY